MAELFKVKLQIEGLDIFKEIIHEVRLMCDDERIPKEVREEYRGKILAIADKGHREVADDDSMDK